MKKKLKAVAGTVKSCCKEQNDIWEQAVALARRAKGTASYINMPAASDIISSAWAYRVKEFALLVLS